MLISRHVWEVINTEAASRLLSGNGIEGLCWESYSPWAAGCCAWDAPCGESMRDSSLPSHPPHPPYGHLLTSSPPHLQGNTARDSPFNSASIWGSHDGFWGPGRPWHTLTPSSPDPYLSCEAHRSVIGSVPSSQGTLTILGSTQTHTSSVRHPSSTVQMEMKFLPLCSNFQTHSPGSRAPGLLNFLHQPPFPPLQL